MVETNLLFLTLTTSGAIDANFVFPFLFTNLPKASYKIKYIICSVHEGNNRISLNLCFQFKGTVECCC